MKEITGGGGSTTPVITACMSRSWKVDVCQKKKRIPAGRRDYQSAISSKEHTSSTKQHRLILVSCVPTRPLALGGKRLLQRSQGPQQQQSAPSSKETSRGKKTPNAYDAIYGTNACHPLVSSVDTVDYYYDLCVGQLGNNIAILVVLSQTLCVWSFFRRPRAVGIFRHTWSAHTKISRR